MTSKLICAIIFMNFDTLQRLRSFTDLSPRSLRFSNFKIFSQTPGLNETKVHIEVQRGRKILVCSLDLGHMIKMQAMHIYGKNIEILHLRNGKSDDLETWSAAFGTLNGLLK